MNYAKKLSTILLLAFAVQGAHADTSQLKVDGDLMIHPSQVAGFFAIAAGNIGATSSWDWPALSFTKPYKTNWSGVQAKGPFGVRFTTANLNKQEVGFELDWNDPLVAINRFEIHDTIVRDVGGARIIIHLDGACNGMQVRMPAGQWKVRGTLKWAWTNNGLQVTWHDFQFANNGQAQTIVDLGQCEGPAGLHQALSEAIQTVSQDHAWMQDVLRDGVLDWVENSLGSLQEELLKTREFDVRPGVTLSWHPNNMTDSGNGLIRVAGQMVVTKQTKAGFSETLARSYDVGSLVHAQESGFVLPKETLPRILEFMQRTGELGYRANSSQIPAFQGLMNNRFLQFFVWPDLMKFAKTTQFYFDLASEQAPVLSGGRSLESGVQYEVQAPLIVKQWAPSATQYLPYVDFRAPLTGQLSAKIVGEELQLHLQPRSLNVGSRFRSEFAAIRRVTTRISNSLLGSRVSDYLASKPLSMKTPAWKLGDGMSLGMKDLKLDESSFRIPLEFKK